MLNVSDLSGRTKCTLSKFMDGTKSERAIDKLEGRTAVQKENSWLKERATRTTKFSKDESDILHLGQENYSPHKYKLQVYFIESSFGKNVRVICWRVG